MISGSLKDLTFAQLIGLHSNISDELKRRGLTRSSNNPLGDLAEHTFCTAFGWTLQPKSTAAFDAICPLTSTRYEIKARRLSRPNSSRMLGALRNLDAGEFDMLAGVLFNSDYTVKRAIIIPHREVLTNARYSSHTNSWRFTLSETVWNLPAAEDVTDQLRKVQI